MVGSFTVLGAMYEGCKTILALLEGYIVEMSEMTPWGMQEEGEDSTDARLEQTNQCEEKLQSIRLQYMLMEANLRALEKKTKSTGEVGTWIDKWHKMDSALGSKIKDSILAYLRSCVSQNRNLRTERELLDKLTRNRKGGQKLKSPRAGGDDADIDDYDVAQPAMGTVTRVKTFVGDDPPEEESQTEPPESMDSTDIKSVGPDPDWQTGDWIDDSEFLCKELPQQEAPDDAQGSIEGSGTYPDKGEEPLDLN